MKLRRCAVVFVELDDGPRLTLTSMLSAGDGLDHTPQWQAYAPHLREPVPVDAAQLAVLEQVHRDGEVQREDLVEAYGETTVHALLEAGLLISDQESPAQVGEADRVARALPWWPPSLVAHVAGGWSGIDIESRSATGLMPDMDQMLQDHGPPPAHEHRRGDGGEALSLSAPSRSDFDALLDQRITCRNFDSAAMVSANDLASMLYRVWGATGTHQLAPGAVAVRKSSPAGGGMHCTEAYLLVQRAEGLQPGLYHYLALEHALEPLRRMDADEAATLAHRFVAGQHWFANVPVMVIMVYRFDRLFWKYRRHSKAWRVAHLDIGHLSQTMYLSAADLGLGAFVTAAINDRDIDAELDLPPLREASIAIVGFGPRAAEKVNIELDNLTPTPASLR